MAVTENIKVNSNDIEERAQVIRILFLIQRI